MDSFLRADLFFFVATVGFVALGVVLLVCCVYAMKILRDIQHITKRARKEADGAFSDFADLRGFLKEEAKRAIDVKEIVRAVVGLIGRAKRGRRRTKKEVAEEA